MTQRFYICLYSSRRGILLENSKCTENFVLNVNEIFIFVVHEIKEVADPGIFSGSLLQFLFLKFQHIYFMNRDQSGNVPFTHGLLMDSKENQIYRQICIPERGKLTFHYFNYILKE